MIVGLPAMPSHSRPPDTMLSAGRVVGMLLMVMHRKAQPAGPFSSTQVQNWQSTSVLARQRSLQADQLATFSYSFRFSVGRVLVLKFTQPKQ